MQVSLNTLNQDSKDDFVACLADVFEHSSWVAKGAVAKRPFETVAVLHKAMVKVVADAPLAKQLQLIRSHPDLAGKASKAGKLTESSSKEQAGAGLDSLSVSEFERFHKLNNAYKEKFNFPFILAVKGHNKNSILQAFETRLKNNLNAERETALAQIAQIARFRLEDLLT